MGESPQQRLLFFKMMYRSMTLLVLVAACCVLAAEPQQQDQEGAEQFYHIQHGFYPSWNPALGAVRVYPYAYGHYNYYGAYPYGVVPGAQPALYGSLPHHFKVNAMETRISQDQENQIPAGRTSTEIQQKQSDYFAKIAGKYCLVGQENFEQYLEAIGLNVDNRAVVMKQVPCGNLNYHDDQWSVQMTGIGKDYDFKFQFGVEMKRTTEDGRPVTDLFTLVEVGDTFKIVQKETWENKEAVKVHEFDGDNLKVTFTLGDVKASRHFRRE